MIYLVSDPFTGVRFEFEDEALANTKAEEIRLGALEREAYRFTVAKEVVNGNDTTWTNADLGNDPEEGSYHVFNTFTGLHEKVDSLSAAKTRQAEIKVEFANSLPVIYVLETSDIAQPISQGAQTL